MARGGAEVAVRVNNEPDLLAGDVDAAIHPGLDTIAFPKAESAEQIRSVVTRIEGLERTRGLTPGHVRGTASVNVEGKMVDVPVYKRALVVLARARSVAETERRKAQALARLG